jgi:hypothetical protein
LFSVFLFLPWKLCVVSKKKACIVSSMLSK